MTFSLTILKIENNRYEAFINAATLNLRGAIPTQGLLFYSVIEDVEQSQIPDLRRQLENECRRRGILNQTTFK